MIVTSDKLNCYIEGIKIPIIDANIAFTRNTYSKATIKIVFGEIINTEMFANALVQLTYRESLENEHLLFQGLIKELIINEASSFMWILADSTWAVFKMNKVLDYVAPKRYGIFNVLDEMVVYLGNEEEIHVDPKNNDTSFAMSQRFFYHTKEADEIKLNEPESFKLEFIINKTPFAERFAFSFFEDIAYNNFLLTEAHASRLNLLAKSKDSLRIATSLFQLDNAYKYSDDFIKLDERFTGLKYKKAKYIKNQSEVRESNFNSVANNLPYQAISEKAKQDILSKQNKWKNQVTIEQILSAYDRYCQQINIDPNLLIAQARQESVFDPNEISRAGAKGWSQFMDLTWQAYKPPGGSQFNVLDSIYAQCKYMADLLREGGSIEEALGRYNGGGNWRNKSESRNYVLLVTQIYTGYVNR